jgi:hypothetical protein
MVHGQMRHIRNDDDDDEFDVDRRFHNSHVRSGRISAAPCRWLEKRLDWWDDDYIFAAALAERKRDAARHPRRGTRTAKRKKDVVKCLSEFEECRTENVELHAGS